MKVDKKVLLYIVLVEINGAKYFEQGKKRSWVLLIKHCGYIDQICGKSFRLEV